MISASGKLILYCHITGPVGLLKPSQINLQTYYSFKIFEENIFKDNILKRRKVKCNTEIITCPVNVIQ